MDIDHTQFSFEVHATDGLARAGILTTPHGDIKTPVFMPVGTQATVKAMKPEDVDALGAQIVLSNTYHLYLRPGVEIVAKAGGLHKFMRWPKPILTDSGGFQVFSLASRREVLDEGVRFRSHIDGSEHLFTPENVIKYQEFLGADIIMAFDECAPYPADKSYVKEAMERTHRWLERCIASKTRPDQALFGIVQGGIWLDLREESALFVSSMDLPGYGIGGLSVGEDKEQMLEALSVVTAILPMDKPRYLMGVGSPEDLLNGIALGVDMFDCVLPTRNARNGALLVPTGRLNIRNAQFKEDFTPIQEDCDCYTCSNFTRAYLHHLFRAEELLAYTLATTHNLRFLVRLMDGAREAILKGKFEDYRQQFLAGFQPPDPDARKLNRERRFAGLLEKTK